MTSNDIASGEYGFTTPHAKPEHRSDYLMNCLGSLVHSKCQDLHNIPSTSKIKIHYFTTIRHKKVYRYQHDIIKLPG